MSDKQFGALLRKAASAAIKHAEMVAQITEAFETRYGMTHSDVDCDGLIECLDYGGGSAPSVRECDRLMAEAMRMKGIAPYALAPTAEHVADTGPEPGPLERG